MIQVYRHKELEHEEKEMGTTPFEKRLANICEGYLPTRIDRTPDGVFVIEGSYPHIKKTDDGFIIDGKPIKLSFDKKGNLKLTNKKTKKALGYFLNEDCVLSFETVKGKVKAYFYSDADKKYYFDVDLKETMSDEQIRIAMVTAFSYKFGWVEKFE